MISYILFPASAVSKTPDMSCYQDKNRGVFRFFQFDNFHNPLILLRLRRQAAFLIGGVTR